MDEREKRIKRLLYQSWYRGCKETDKILGPFARACLEEFSDAELDEFEALMAEEDRDLFAWITGMALLPERYQGSTVMQRLLDYDVAESLR